MGPQKMLEGLGLGLAQLGEACGGVPHGAVMLAQLRTGLGFDRRRRVAVTRESIGQEHQARLRVANVLQCHAMTFDERVGALAGERENGLLAVRALDEVQRGDSEVVVIDVEGVAAGVRQGEHPRGTPTTAHGRGAERPLVIGLHESLGHEGIEVAAHDCRGVPKAPSQLRGGRGTAVEERAGNALSTGAREFHTLSVSQIRRRATGGGSPGPDPPVPAQDCPRGCGRS